ncbi:NAD(P)-dependent malic enzyme [Sporohalobacter salinus]|uniref:NAD(P)-dependent malic enzyme n=1 Tax=Sporohalobacter salinus TaxID=1494606 RepID=UPI001961E7DE|nr:NADP-dependent malic enzyme [Sporohalobacter salinus]MBM7624490.1 malate dehydrogenase (oxaloacetate-decarboxylating) [Sporohalobacter salinus]
MIIKEDALMGYEMPEKKEKKEIQDKLEEKSNQRRKAKKRKKIKNRTDFLQAIIDDPEKVYKYTNKGNRVAVVSNGSSVLDLGEVGAEAVLPIVESKVKLLKKYGKVEAVPICLNTTDVNELATTIKSLAPAYGAIFLEDIVVQDCIELQCRLQSELSIPIYHDDQLGRAIVVLAALYNAVKVIDKSLEDLRVVIAGSEVVNLAIIELLLTADVKEIILYDKFKILQSNDSEFDLIKEKITQESRVNIMEDNLKQSIVGADVLLGNGLEDIQNQQVIQEMKEDPIIFSLADSILEVTSQTDNSNGIKAISTSNFSEGKQINSQLVFPGLIKGLLHSRKKRLSQEVQLVIARVLASLVDEPALDNILPNAFDPKVMMKTTEAIMKVVTNTKTTADKLKNRDDLPLEVMEHLLD